MRTQRRDEGSALLVTVLLLVLLGMVGLAALDTVTRDLQVAGYQGQARLAFYAAEAAVAQAQQLVDGAGADQTPPLALASLGDVTLYPNGTPTYEGDPAFSPTPIRSVGSQVYTGGSGNITTGRPTMIQNLWLINVIGRTPGGASSRIEALLSSVDDEAVGYGG